MAPAAGLTWRRSRCTARASRARGRRSNQGPRLKAKGPRANVTRVGLGPCSLLRFELQRHTIDAVAESARRRTVGKHVTEVAAALAAVDFGPHHPPALIHRRLDRALDG